MELVLRHSYRSAVGWRVSVLGNQSSCLCNACCSASQRRSKKVPHFCSSISHCHVPFLLWHRGGCIPRPAGSSLLLFTCLFCPYALRWEDVADVPFHSDCNPVSISLSTLVFQSGSLWAWWSWGRSCSSFWWESAGASVAHTAAAVTSAARAVPSPAAVPGRVSDPVQAWRKSSRALLPLPGRTGGESANIASFALSTFLD